MTLLQTYLRFLTQMAVQIFGRKINAVWWFLTLFPFLSLTAKVNNNAQPIRMLRHGTVMVRYCHHTTSHSYENDSITRSLLPLWSCSSASVWILSGQMLFLFLCLGPFPSRANAENVFYYYPYIMHSKLLNSGDTLIQCCLLLSVVLDALLSWQYIWSYTCRCTHFNETPPSMCNQTTK